MPRLGIIRSSGLAFLSLGTSSARLGCLEVCMYMLILRISRPCLFFFSFLQTGRTGYTSSISSSLITVTKLGLSPGTGVLSAPIAAS
ncbi:hypothetical protein V8C34DRAFT_276387 [Trichoderma compactum]